jgi:S1-C subfamily serine protease
MGLFKFFAPPPRTGDRWFALIILGMTIALSVLAINPALALAIDKNPPNSREMAITAVQQADLSSRGTPPNPPMLALRSPELPAQVATDTNSFVTAAVDRVGPAVVRIDTERTVSRNLDPLMEDPSSADFWEKICAA